MAIGLLCFGAFGISEAASADIEKYQTSTGAVQLISFMDVLQYRL
jgi:hypothetical protein